MNPNLPPPASSLSEIKTILDQCLQEYWAPRFNELTIDHQARMYAALQPFIRYQMANCPMVDGADQGNS
jgi:hypothetical protein